jgi:hypothetical protein
VPLGSAEFTHPFHPLRGQRLPVLKIRRVSGVKCLSLCHADRGSFAVPEEWTDWGKPNIAHEPELLVDAFGFSELALIVDFLARYSKRN